MTGEEFVKKIRPLGCAAFLLLFAGVLLACLLSGQKPISGYEPPHDSSYYAQNQDTLEELRQELEENVFPYMDGVQSCTVGDGVLEITIDSGSFAVTRGKILKYFDKNLFLFREG